MTPFALLEALAGLSHREAAEFHKVRPDTVQSWATGRNRCPDGALNELRALIGAQERAAAQAIDIIKDEAPEAVDLGFPADDAEARSLGWPCVGAWAAMAARIIADSPLPVRLVARGATPASAAAADERERRT